MSSNAARATVLVLAIAAAVALFVALSGEDDEVSSPTTTAATRPGEEGAQQPREPKPEPKPQAPTIRIEDGRPVGGVRELTFRAGEEIRFYVASDAPAHVHLHGYDVFKDVPAGGRTRFAVPADIEGVFEVEIETTATQLAEIVVEP